jgi:Na+-transporting methylmalonyl-CoA/oxaloacetate decarboxylase gamma subunit
MDSFTIAILIGGAVVLLVLVGLIVVDRGAPEPASTTKPEKKSGEPRKPEKKRG